MSEALGIATTVAAILSLVISLVALRRSSTEARLARETVHRDAALDRFVAGPIPNISVVVAPRESGARVIKMVVHNSGRTAITMSGGGLAFDLVDGGRRHITIRYGEEVRLDPEGSPRGYSLTAPVLRDVLDEAADGSDIYPFVIFGTRTVTGKSPLPRQLIEMAMEDAPPAPDQTFSVVDSYDDYMCTRELVPDSDGRGYSITDGIFHTIVGVVRDE
jgi:hypothetical protein